MSKREKTIRKITLNPVLWLFVISITVFLVGAWLVYLLLWWLASDEKILKAVLYSSLASFFTFVCLLALYACIFKFRGTLLHYAVFSSRKRFVKWLIAKGVDANAKTKTGWTPLHDAAGFGHKDIAKILISNGAVVNAKDKNGQAPLHLAASDGNKEMVEFLIANGAEINVKNNNGKTPANIAAEQDHKEVVELLNGYGVAE